jgi:hypothetical protein
MSRPAASAPLATRQLVIGLKGSSGAGSAGRLGTPSLHRVWLAHRGVYITDRGTRRRIATDRPTGLEPFCHVVIISSPIDHCDSGYRSTRYQHGIDPLCFGRQRKSRIDTDP